MAYKLQLLLDIEIHDVFHMSLFKLVHAPIQAFNTLP